ncbi:MAG TPA: universal stress protein [Rhizomicrobium sp.]|nr:universal stress protein [Rhizomicrobium sp.]
MTIKMILAPLTGGKRDALTLACAFSAAIPMQAHVRGLFARPDPMEALPFFGDEVAPAMASEIVDSAREAAGSAAASARTALEAAAAAAGFELQEVPAPGPSASYLEAQGHFDDCVAHAGLLADLIVFGPLGETDHPGLTEAFEAALLKTGSPVLLGSRTQQREFRKIAIGWNGSATSAHAVSASLPFLSRAHSIHVITIQSASSDADMDALLDYLRVHAVSAVVSRADASTRVVGDVLLETATSNGADLLVIGGYGHGRLREWLTGGVTRRVLSRATLPLFLMH